MPPFSRNHRTPTGGDTPATIAARSLVRPPRSQSKTACGSLVAKLAAAPATAAVDVLSDSNAFSYCSSQLPQIWVLRRPIESTQYVSLKYTARLADAGLVPSVGSVGDSYDNALAEPINGLYKAEVVHRRGPWRTLEAVEYATLEWVDWFKNRRLLQPIGNLRRLKPKPHTTQASKNLPNSPRDSNQTASENLGTVQRGRWPCPRF